MDDYEAVAGDEGAGLRAELLRELTAGHPLHGQHLAVVERSTASDDIVVELADGRRARVHLTWSGKPETAPWPSTEFLTRTRARRREPAYPFAPKSTTYLTPGQFWAVSLRNGRFACGRVLQIAGDQDDNASDTKRMFLGGLLDWTDDKQPTADSIAGAALLAQGKAHIKTITATGGALLGRRPLEDDGLRPFVRLTHRAGGTVDLYEGLTRLRPADETERCSLPLMETWGFRFIEALADRRLGRLR